MQVETDVHNDATVNSASNSGKSIFPRTSNNATYDEI
jgi:hypothetical protein